MFNVKKNGKKSLIQTGEMIGGAFATNAIHNLAPVTIRKFIPAAAVALGFGAQMVDNEHVRNIGAGMATMGAVNAVKEYAEDKVPQLAMISAPNKMAVTNGFGYLETTENYVDLLGIEATPDYEEDDEYDEYEILNGMYDEDDEEDDDDFEDDDEIELEGIEEDAIINM